MPFPRSCHSGRKIYCVLRPCWRLVLTASCGDPSVSSVPAACLRSRLGHLLPLPSGPDTWILPLNPSLRSLPLGAWCLPRAPGPGSWPRGQARGLGGWRLWPLCFCLDYSRMRWVSVWGWGVWSTGGGRAGAAGSGGPPVGTPHFHCRGPPGWGTRIPQAMRCGKNKIK